MNLARTIIGILFVGLMSATVAPSAFAQTAPMQCWYNFADGKTYVGTAANHGTTLCPTIQEQLQIDQAAKAAAAQKQKAEDEAHQAELDAQQKAQAAAAQAAKDAADEAYAQRWANRAFCGDVLPSKPKWSDGVQRDDIYCKSGPGGLPACNTVDTTATWCFLHDGMGEDDIHEPHPLSDFISTPDTLKIQNGIWYDCWNSYRAIHNFDPDANAFTMDTHADVNIGCSPVNS